ncbi:PIN domain-containing protein [Maricaulis sp.]|uniref:PIN domain-containing protein n=1 Tax=Maricaulis sp. TaxID=1486257 RepID=UPI003A9488FE
MIDVADRFVIILDANVLYPFRVRDALLRFNEAGLFRARWSKDILDEWENALLRTRPQHRQSVTEQRQAMREAFAEAWVDGYQALIPALTLPDENDCHVLAAAIRAGAQHIVTENLKDFPDGALAPFGIEAISADAILANTFSLYPAESAAALARMRRAYKRPPMTAVVFLDDLTRAGLPKLALLAREFVDTI